LEQSSVLVFVDGFVLFRGGESFCPRKFETYFESHSKWQAAAMESKGHEHFKARAREKLKCNFGDADLCGRRFSSGWRETTLTAVLRQSTVPILQISVGLGSVLAQS